jgi:DNA relaxase NicK
MSESSTSVPMVPPVIIESQLDWLTCGFDAGPTADRAEAWAFARAQAEHRAGFREAPFRVYGFEGWMVGRVRWGRRGAMAMVQLSGQLAEDYADSMYSRADRISRVDLAVTVRLPAYDKELAARAYAEATAWHEAHPKGALPKLIQDGNGGATCYLGSRASDKTLRIYNKAAEAHSRDDGEQEKHYDRCWRYELEVKTPTAWPTVERLLGQPDRAATIANWISLYCAKHGITPHIPAVKPEALMPGFRRRSDTESRLTWLRRSVNPAILTLLAEVDYGEILDALGMGEPSPGETARRKLSVLRREGSPEPGQ